MPIYHRKINGRKVWWVRITHKGLNASRVCQTKEAAKAAHDELRQGLRGKAERAEVSGAAPANMKALFELYAADMQARGKDDDSGSRVEYTARAVEDVMPELLGRSVSSIRDTDIFAFRNARAREGKKVVVTVAGERVERRVPGEAEHDQPGPPHLRAMLKKARPDYPLPGGRVLPGGRDARPVAPARGGAPRPRDDALALPGDRQAGRTDPDAADGDPDASAGRWSTSSRG